MSSQVIADADAKMARAVEAMERDFQGMRTGRASTALVERIHVEYYGTSTPLNQLAGISVPEPHQIVIQPWDRGVLGAIEKAITKSDIGIMPNVDGTVVRLNIPPLTEERRKEIVRGVHKRMEEARVEIRNLRREGADQLKKQERDGGVGADEAHRELEALQKTTDRYRRGGSPRRGEGTGDPGGLVTRASIARPADATSPSSATRDPAAVGDAEELGIEPGRPAAARRDHHGRQPALGARGGPERGRGPCRRRRSDPADHPARGPSRRPGPVAVRLQQRELVPVGRGGQRPVRAAGGGDPQRDGRVASAGRARPAAGTPRGAAGRDASVDR